MSHNAKPIEKIVVTLGTVMLAPADAGIKSDDKG
jgi:hypothetical protein